MIGVISDIHGNLPALRAVMQRLDELGCKDVICLGDVVGYYAQPGECIDVLWKRGITNILGNHDYYIISGEGCPRSKLVSKIAEYQRGILSADQVAWLSRSCPYIRQDRTCFVHGGWQNLMDQYLYEISECIFPDEIDILFAGHTHVQALIELRNRCFCNPGSVGQPRDGDARSAFAIFSAGAITLHRVAYDIDETAFHMRKAGFPARCYENLYSGAQIGGRTDRIVVRSCL